MNNDRELLERAAKAAGYSIDFEDPVNGFYVNGYDENGDPAAWWNPLTDDGDALRLAVKLGIRPGISGKYVGARWQPQGNAYLEPIGIPCFEIGDDPYAATRRAIVLAAVEIGKQ